MRSPTPSSHRRDAKERVQIDARPCVRYYFAAKRSSPTATDWHVVVAGYEPIGECVRKFGGGTL